MRDVLFLAWRYLRYHRLKTAVLVGAVAVVIALPLGLRVLVDSSAEHLTARAAATPLLIGGKGSPLELVLNSLYFDSDTPAPMRYAQVRRVGGTGLATPVPLYTRFRARQLPIVGTTPEYFAFRGLRIAEGRGLAVLGECLLGARAARALGLTAGDQLVSSPETVFDLAGVYPLKMRVAGVLAAAGGPDDRAVFVDLKTAWVIEGLAHGHQDLSRPEATGGVLERRDGRIVANASVRQYNEVTPDNIGTFHFHGELDEFPVTSVIAIPADTKAETLLRGRYLGDDEVVQVVRPLDVMDQLLATVLTVRRYVATAVAGISGATLATISLVFVLSLELRRRELETLVKIGGSRGRIAGIVAAEIVGVLAAGGLAAGLIVIVMSRLGETFIRWFILS